MQSDYQLIHSVVNGSYQDLPSQSQIPESILGELKRYAVAGEGWNSKLGACSFFLTLPGADGGNNAAFFGRIERKRNAVYPCFFLQSAGWLIKDDEWVLRHINEMLSVAFCSEEQVDEMAGQGAMVPPFESDALLRPVTIDKSALRAIVYGCMRRWLKGEAPLRIAVEPPAGMSYEEAVLSYAGEIYSFFPARMRQEIGFCSYLSTRDVNIPRFSLHFMPKSTADAKTLSLDGSTRTLYENLKTTGMKELNRMLDELLRLEDPEERLRFLETVNQFEKIILLENKDFSPIEYRWVGLALELLEGSAEVRKWLRFVENKDKFPKELAQEIEKKIEEYLTPKALLDYAEQVMKTAPNPASLLEVGLPMLLLCKNNEDCRKSVIEELRKRMEEGGFAPAEVCCALERERQKLDELMPDEAEKLRNEWRIRKITSEVKQKLDGLSSQANTAVELREKINDCLQEYKEKVEDSASTIDTERYLCDVKKTAADVLTNRLQEELKRLQHRPRDTKEGVQSVLDELRELKKLVSESTSASVRELGVKLGSFETELEKEIRRYKPVPPLPDPIQVENKPGEQPATEEDEGEQDPKKRKPWTKTLSIVAVVLGTVLFLGGGFTALVCMTDISDVIPIVEPYKISVRGFIGLETLDGATKTAIHSAVTNATDNKVDLNGMTLNGPALTELFAKISDKFPSGEGVILNLSGVKLSNENAREVLMDQLAKLMLLKQLDLSGIEGVAPDTLDFSRLRKLTELELLDLRGLDGVTQETVGEMIKNNASCVIRWSEGGHRKLAFGGSVYTQGDESWTLSVGEKGLAPLSPWLTELASLKRLTLSGTLTDTDMKVVSEWVKKGKLETLSFSDTEQIEMVRRFCKDNPNIAVISSVLYSVDRTTTLELSGSTLTEPDWENLAKLAKLVSLDLSSESEADVTGFEIRKYLEQLTALKEVNLNNLTINDNDLFDSEHNGPANWVKNLRRLELRNTGITRLPDMRGLLSLRYVDISDNLFDYSDAYKIGDGLARLDSAHYLFYLDTPGLQELHMSHIELKIFPLDKEKGAAKLKNLRILDLRNNPLKAEQLNRLKTLLDALSYLDLRDTGLSKEDIESYLLGDKGEYTWLNAAENTQEEITSALERARRGKKVATVVYGSKNG